jgi:hypothetical protein
MAFEFEAAVCELAILVLGLKVEDQATGRRCATVSGCWVR